MSLSCGSRAEVAELRSIFFQKNTVNNKQQTHAFVVAVTPGSHQQPASAAPGTPPARGRHRTARTLDVSSSLSASRSTPRCCACSLCWLQPWGRCVDFRVQVSSITTQAVGSTRHRRDAGTGEVNSCSSAVSSSVLVGLGSRFSSDVCNSSFVALRVECGGVSLYNEASNTLATP